MSELPELGDFGAYTDVFEVAFGAEGFTPAPGARPVLGTVGHRSLSPTLTFTAHINSSISETQLSSLLARILQAHPWEVPVVELSATSELILPGETM